MQQLRITVEGKSFYVTVEKLDSTNTSTPARSGPARTAPASPVSKPKVASKPVAAAGDVTSPLAGIVKSIDVAVGAKVKAGDLVLTLEAMKMYTSINAPTDGTVTGFHVATGDAVDEDQALYTLS